MEYDVTIKRKKILIHATKWRKAGNIMQSDRLREGRKHVEPQRTTERINPLL